MIAAIVIPANGFTETIAPIPAYIRTDEGSPLRSRYVGILEGSATATFTIVIHIWDRREGAYVTRNAYTSTGVLLKNAVPTIIVIPRESNGGLELPE